MIESTATAINGWPVCEYVGVPYREAVLGAKVFQDGVADLRYITGGRCVGYERSLRQACEKVIEEMVAQAEQMGSDAVIGADVNHESIQLGQGVACSWSAPRRPPSSCSLWASSRLCPHGSSREGGRK